MNAYLTLHEVYNASSITALSDLVGRKPAIITGGVVVTIGGALQSGAYHIWLDTVHDFYQANLCTIITILTALQVS